MPLSELLQKIADRQAMIGVIGIGYVGLPVACSFAKAGFQVIGVDLKPELVEHLNNGLCPIEGEEPGLAELLQQVVSSGNFTVTSDYECLDQADIILIAVETPIDERRTPDYEALLACCRSLGPVLKPGSLVIVESTVSPGTTKDYLGPTLEKNSGLRVNHNLFLGTCPERVMPGKLLHNLRYVNRVCGGLTEETAAAMVALYSTIVDAQLDSSDTVTAELVKTTENAYRDVQIAFANEIALVCEELGADAWQVRELVNRSPYREMHLPGAGVGGHCIPKDPWLLAHPVKDTGAALRLIPTARLINDSMPGHVLKLITDALIEAIPPEWALIS